MVDEGEGEERVARFFGVGGDDSVVASQVSGWDSGEVELDLRRRENSASAHESLQVEGKNGPLR